jgi:hypothetical protein
MILTSCFPDNDIRIKGLNRLAGKLEVDERLTK